MAYGKIFESLFTGSMVGSGLNVFAVWSYCIANAKPPGTIELNPVILATVFGCPVEEVESAIDKLCQPDPKSRTKECEGRRLINEGPYLYSIPTWEKYNQIRNEIARRQQNREAQSRWRKRVSHGVRAETLTSAESAHVEVEKEAEVEKEEKSTPRKRGEEPKWFPEFWKAYAYAKDKPASIKAWKKINPSEELAATITAKAAEYAASNPTKEYHRHPATWLNGEGWNDELTKAVSSNKNKTGGQLWREQNDGSSWESSKEITLPDLLEEGGY